MRINEIINVFQVSKEADMRERKVCSRLCASYQCN